jgi:hypothetical protein
VSSWADEQAARAEKQVAEHLVAQQRGREVWYSDDRVRVAVVHRDHGPCSSSSSPGAQVPSSPAVSPDLASSSCSSSCAASSTRLCRHSAAR